MKGNAPQTRLALTLGAIGVVFGDIGTSPLYVIRECLGGRTANETTLLGIGSIIFWTLTLVVTLKYVTFLLNATSHGEGGVFALFALVRRSRKARPAFWAGCAMLGAALLYGDGMITPAISVLAAVEGLEHLSPKWESTVVPLTCVILVLLFLIQPLGTGRLGRRFGVIMVLWFLAIGSVGVVQILQQPNILRAIHPGHAVHFIRSGDTHSLTILGGVLLCITGAEALFADVGHFGKSAVRIGWWGLVKPCLLASYFGQLAWLMQAGHAVEANPFFGIVPGPLEVPMVILATVATVIASQALISGVFSLTEQGIRLGFLPNSRIVHTSESQAGQVYLPRVNWLLLAACLALVLAFRSSDNLANAYGFAVIAGMAVSSVFLAYYLLRIRHWSLIIVSTLVGGWLVMELSFLIAASTKFLHGAWIPIVITTIVVTVMSTWRWGRKKLRVGDAAEERQSVKAILSSDRPSPRIAGSSGVILSGQSLKPELSHYIERFGALPEQLILLSVEHGSEARVDERERYHLHQESRGVHHLTVRVGYAERPDLALAVTWARSHGSEIDPETANYVVFRRALVPQQSRSRLKSPLKWRYHLFIFLYRRADPAWQAFVLPANQVVEIGIREVF